MSGMSDNAQAKSKKAPTGDYSVGYGRPPKHHQFKKGTSGNPKGRPRKTNDERLYEEMNRRITMQEAYRWVAVREGENTVNMRAMQAALRVMFTLGIKGNGPMLRAWVSKVCEIEADQRRDKLARLDAAVAYKEKVQEIREKAKKEGAPVPCFVPDPDDIHIEWPTGNVKVTGPVNPEDKAERDWLRARKASWELELAEVREELKETPDDPQLLKEMADAEEILEALKRLGI